MSTDMQRRGELILQLRFSGVAQFGGDQWVRPRKKKLGERWVLTIELFRGELFQNVLKNHVYGVVQEVVIETLKAIIGPVKVIRDNV